MEGADNGDELKWELSKENIQPLKQGRIASVLSSALGESDNSNINQDRQYFESRLRSYTGNDPLEVWYEYALWTEQNFPKGGNDGNLKQLIIRCVRSFHNECSEQAEQYKNDKRYLDLWLKYARLTKNTLLSLETLYSKDIFTELALFYEEYCWELECVKNYKLADKIYREGLQRRAQPLDALEEAHKQFQARVLRYTMEGSTETPEMSQPQRTVFSKLKSHGSKKKAPVDRVAHSAPGGPGKITSSNTSNARGQSFQIFTDEGNTFSKPSSASASKNSLPIGSSSSRENTKDPSVWHKNKLPQKTTNVVKVEDVRGNQQRFEFHHDSEIETPSKVPVGSNALQYRKAQKLEEDEVTPLFIPDPFDPNVKVMYPKHLVYRGMEEFSLEEIWAEQQSKREAEKSSLENLIKNKVQAEMSEMQMLIERQQQQINLLISMNTGSSSKDITKDTAPQKQPTPKVIVTRGTPEAQSIVTVSRNEEILSEIEPMKYDLNVTEPPAEISNRLIGLENESKLKPLGTSLLSKPNKSNVYEDSFLAFNQTANHSVNLSTMHNESKGHNLMPLQTPGRHISNISNLESVAAIVPCPDLSEMYHDKSPDISNFASPVKELSSETNIMPSGSPTINMKNAMKDMNEIFSLTLSVGTECSKEVKEKPSEQVHIYSDPTPESSEPFKIFSDSSPQEPFKIFSDSTPQDVPAAAPFTIFSDAAPSPSIDLQHSDNSLPQPQQIQQEVKDENVPPPDYVQKKEKRHFAGILQPSIQVPLMEEKCEEPKSSFNKNSPCIDIGEASPIKAFEDEYTLPCLPSNETFFQQARVASTPASWSHGIVPQAQTFGDDYTMAFFKIKDKLLEEEPISGKENEDSGELMPPPSDCHIVTVDPNVGGEKTLGPLSPILEMSRENRSSSSSGSSGMTMGTTAFTPFSMHHQSNSQLTEASSMNITNKNQLAVTSDISKSGYLGDKSRGDSITDHSSSKKVFKRKSLFQQPIEESVFNPSDKMAALFEECDTPTIESPGALCYMHPSSNDNDRIQLPNPIDPFSDTTRDAVLGSLSIPVSARPGYNVLSIKVPVVKANSQLTFGNEHYRVRKLRGQGAYAQVYQASTFDPMNVTVFPTEGEDDEEPEENQMILKVEKPKSEWEFYVCSELRDRLKKNGHQENMLNRFMRINRGYYFNNGSILVSQYHKYGTLLDLQNCFVKAGATIQEDLIMIFTIEIINILSAIHKCEIIHADIKPDNFIVINIPTVNLNASSTEEFFIDQTPTLKLIDFGRSIDMKKLPVGSKFTEKVTTDGFTCCEMRDGRPWTYQTDIFGLAGTIHCLLWGRYMNVTKSGSNWVLQGSEFKRYWATDLWKEFYNTCLNIPSCGEFPDFTELKKKFIQKLVDKKTYSNTTCETILKQYKK